MSLAPDRFAFNTVTMGGHLDHKLAHIRSAGFSCVELWARDLVEHRNGVGAAAAVQGLERRGYRGHYTFEVFNDDYAASDPATVAARAMKSARWISESVLTAAPFSPCVT